MGSSALLGTSGSTPEAGNLRGFGFEDAQQETPLVPRVVFRNQVKTLPATALSVYLRLPRAAASSYGCG